MRLGWPWIGSFAVLVACIPLFAWDHHFFGDWPNHLAMIGYFGEYLKAHAALPAMFHTNETIGRATPLFYGQLCWPALGLLAAAVGPRGALSLLVAGLLVLQFASVRALVRAVTADETIACAAATIVTWAIYPLTDLYNRAAIPEFLAITSLQAGTCLWVRYARDPARYDRSSVWAALLVTVAIGTHPPTALFGGITFGVVWLTSLWLSPERRRVAVRSLPLALAGVLALAPWIYVMAKFGPHLGIVRGSGSLSWFPASLDAVRTRLSPLPTVGPDPTGMNTPNLDAQVSLPLVASLAVLGVAAVAARGRQRPSRGVLVLGIVCAGMAAALLVASVSTFSWRMLPKAFAIVQFPYRLVAFVNLAALVALAGVLAAVAGGGDTRGLALGRRVLGFALVLAAAEVACKVPRCLASGSGDDAVVADYANPPRACYFGSEDYVTPDAFPAAGSAGPRRALALPVGGARGFGVAGAADVTVAARTLIVTNVQAFAWNALAVDGRVLRSDETVVDGIKLSAWVDAGTHDVRYRFRPAPAWRALRSIAMVTAAGWMVVALAWPTLRARRLRFRS